MPSSVDNVKLPRGKPRKTRRTVPRPAAPFPNAQTTDTQVTSQNAQEQLVGNQVSLLITTGASQSSTPQLSSLSTSRQSSVRTTSPHPVQSPVAASKGLKRKLEVYVNIPPSPLQRTSPATTPSVASPLVRRLSRPVVEIPFSPTLRAPKNNFRNGISGSPLSAKAFNLNTTTQTESPSKKSKLSMDSTSKDMGGTLRCHQCSSKYEPTDLVICKDVNAAGRSCQVKFCAKCLRRRYNESFDIAQASDASWSCPKCRDICNCSRCMRSRGFQPVGVFKRGVDAETFLLKPLTDDKRKSRARPGAVGSLSRTVITPRTRANIPSMSSFPVVELHSSRPNATGGPFQASIYQVKAQKSKRKKAIREPKWTALPTKQARSEVEDRIYLREFIFRFSTLMPKIQAHHLESLDEFGTFSQATAAVIILELIDLIVLETEDDKENRVLRAACDRLTSAGSLPAAIWAILKEVQSSLNDETRLLLSDPSTIPAYMEDKAEEAEIPAAPRTRRNARKEVLELDNGVKHAFQLMPPILSLCERAMQGPSIRAEIEEGCDDRKGENRAYYAEVKKENERWAQNRKKYGVEEDDVEDIILDNNKTSKGKNKPGFQWSKIKDIAAYKEALAEHRAKLANIENMHLLELQSQMPRFGPLGRDSQGRVYYACSARRLKDKRNRGKAPDADVRGQMKKWGWFLAVWGHGGSESAKRASSEEDDDDGDENEERWWGFADPAEIRQLARWLSSEEGLDEKPVQRPTKMPVSSPVKRKLNSANMSGLNLGPPTRRHLTSLVKSLDEYADLLAWRIGDC